MTQFYAENGVPIPDIDAYASKRGDEMVIYEIEYWLNRPGGPTHWVVGRCPAFWFDNFTQTPTANTTGRVREIRRYYPPIPEVTP